MEKKSAACYEMKMMSMVIFISIFIYVHACWYARQLVVIYLYH